MSKRYYVHCPNCRARMRRTGKKQETEYELYLREFKCSNCGTLAVYNEARSSITIGSFYEVVHPHPSP